MSNLKKKNILVGKEFLVIQMNHWVLFTVAVTAQGMVMESRPAMLSWGLCSLFPFSLFLVRQNSNKIMAFMMLHISLAAAMLFFLPSEGVQGILFSVYVVGYVIHSIFLRLKIQNRQNTAMLPPVAVGIIAIMLLLQNYQGQKGWDVYYIFALTIFVGLYFVYYFIERYQYFLLVNEGSSSHMPKTEMFRSGMGLVVMYTFFSIVVLLLSANINWLYQLMYRAKQGIADFLRWLLIMLGTEEELQIENMTTPEEIQLPLESMENSEPFWLWVVLEKIVIAVIVCLLLAAAVLCMVKLIRFLHERFSRKLKKQVIELNSSVDVREKCEIVRKKTKKKAFLSFLQPRERIRKIYRKKIWEEHKALIGEADSKQLHTFTARECGRQLGMEKMTDIYEKARYSDQECTAEDVRQC